MIQELFKLDGKVALVTGGGKGIGAMITKGLVESGAKVYISSRSQEACDAYAAEMSKLGKCVALPKDLSKLENIIELVDELKSQEEHLDILVNNSGATWGTDFESFPEKGWDKVMDLNAKSVFFLSQKLLPLLKKNASQADPSRIINISSVMSESTVSLGAFSYSASKAAVTHMSRCLARELADDFILVNTVGPGFFPTDMTSHLPKDAIASEVPLKRLGSGDDIAGLVVFLSSKASSYITGSYIPVDGGFLIKS